MISTYEISKAVSTAELYELVARATAERNCELDSGSDYAVARRNSELEKGGDYYAAAAVWYEEEWPMAGNGREDERELAEILRAAEKRWFELAQ